MAFTRTNERLFNRALVALAAQSAEGTPVLDFTASSALVAWARRVVANENQQFETFQGANGTVMEHTDGYLNSFRLPEIEIEFYPTKTIMTDILRSFAGPFAGTAVTWPVGISTLFSFLVADAPDGFTPAQNVYRYEDCFVREIEIETGGFRVAVCRARIIAQKVTPFDTDAVGLVYPEVPADFQQFAHGISEFIKDPASENLQLAVDNVRVNLSHAFQHEPFNSEDGLITKQGFLEVTGNLRGRMMNETSPIRQDALAATLRAYRLRLVNGADEIRFDLNNMIWSPTNVGFADRRFVNFDANFRSGSSDPATENSVDINILP